MHEHEFTFSRGRGIVWVCDIEGSSRLLNNNDSVTAVETFLPRFHWIAREAVDAAGGQFIKWTGDGFLAWFPIELHRELGAQSASVLNIIWHLTVLCNVTRLGVETNIKLRLRHGVSVEHDALITHISGDGNRSHDLMGRAVVLAFRLSGIKAQFPGIVAQREIVDASREQGFASVNFKKLALSAEDRLRYFKGEKWGTSSLFVSSDRLPRPSGQTLTFPSHV